MDKNNELDNLKKQALSYSRLMNNDPRKSYALGVVNQMYENDKISLEDADNMYDAIRKWESN